MDKTAFYCYFYDMKESVALKIMDKVKNDYEEIAAHFSQTRGNVWQDILFIKNYVKSDMNILDLGCGNARLLRMIGDLNIDYTGIDFSEKLIAHAKAGFDQKSGRHFVVGSALNLPFENESFDLVISIAFLHHIPSKKLRLKAMEEIARVLKPEGITIITVWNLWQKKYYKYVIKNILLKVLGLSRFDFNDALIPWKKGVFVERYYHAFTMNELKNLARKSFLKIEDIGYTIKNKKRPNIFLIAKKPGRK
jgi:tRNA (uracil-5-)-methyltransferase TRM9